MPGVEFRAVFYLAAVGLLPPTREVEVWFRHRRRDRGQLKEAPGCEVRLVLEMDPELSAKLRGVARARDQSQQALAADLLSRGLEQEALRAQAEVALEALTPREREVARLTSRGYTNHQIAEALVISPETVKTHVRHALEKFDLRSKTELRLLLLDLGIG